MIRKNSPSIKKIDKKLCAHQKFCQTTGVYKWFLSWVMPKSDFRMAHVENWFLFVSANNNFTNFLKMYRNLIMTVAYTNSYRIFFVLRSLSFMLLMASTISSSSIFSGHEWFSSKMSFPKNKKAYYRHSSYNSVLLYRGIPSNSVFHKKKFKKWQKTNFNWFFFASNLQCNNIQEVF